MLSGQDAMIRRPYASNSSGHKDRSYCDFNSFPILTLYVLRFSIAVAREHSLIPTMFYRNEETNSTTMEFFVIDTGPFEMLLGKEFVYERLEREFSEEFAREDLEDDEQPKTLLLGRLRRMTSGKSLSSLLMHKQC